MLEAKDMSSRTPSLVETHDRQWVILSITVQSHDILVVCGHYMELIKTLFHRWEHKASDRRRNLQFTHSPISCGWLGGRVVGMLDLRSTGQKVKGKASSLDIVPLTILNSGALQPRKWQLTGNDCSTAYRGARSGSPEPALTVLLATCFVVSALEV